MTLRAALVAGRQFPVYALSGESVSSVGSAGIRINTDGTIDKREGVGPTYTQIDAATDYVIPNFAAENRTLHIRFETAGGQMLGDVLDTWLELDVAREYYHISSGLTRNGTLRISDDGGATDLTTGVYSLTVP